MLTVTFAAGLATEGYKPFCAIYSTFLQRAYDQVVHDVAIQNLPVRFAIDRAGLVGADGATHAGAFDVACLACLPNMTVMAAADEAELVHMVATCAAHDSGPIALCYPRGEGVGSVFAPLFAIVSFGVLIDMGWPITFWQKRDGKDGEPFLIYKIRTMHAPFDRRGRFVEESRRTSRVGEFLRRTRLDELPQLWNVLTGAMSFVGPRPLLPVDQPSTSKYRLQVRPGLTGWAQIHGGKRVDADDKGVLDDWYVEHASLRLDLSIILSTVVDRCFGRRADRSDVHIGFAPKGGERRKELKFPAGRRPPLENPDTPATVPPVTTFALANREL